MIHYGGNMIFPNRWNTDRPEPEMRSCLNCGEDRWVGEDCQHCGDLYDEEERS